MLIPFLLDPAPGLLERHARQPTSHVTLIAEILTLIAGTSSPGAGSSAAPPGSEGPGHEGQEERDGEVGGGRARLREPLSQAETRVLRYLPTNLSVPEIAGELSVSVNTVKTHMRHVYDKLGVHRHHEATEQARSLRLLAPGSHSAPIR